MDDHRFDALVKTLTTSGSRRSVMQALGGGALAALFGRFIATEDAEAKKKHRKHKKRKKCKRGKRKCNGKCIPKANCCVDADCAVDERCEAGQCLAKRVGCLNDDDCEVGEFCQSGVCIGDECLNDDDCDAGKICQNNLCVPAPPECVENDDCASGEACFGGTCVLIAGTCDATDDHCAVEESLCNPGAGDCFCLQRFGGGAACMKTFVPGEVCGGCSSDAQCEAIEAGSVCVLGCPTFECEPGQGICARLCPNQ
jgi:hypothetical protein